MINEAIKCFFGDADCQFHSLQIIDNFSYPQKTASLFTLGVPSAPVPCHRKQARPGSLTSLMPNSSVKIVDQVHYGQYDEPIRR